MRVVAWLCNMRTWGGASALLSLGACQVYRGELLQALPDASVDAGHAREGQSSQGMHTTPVMRDVPDSGVGVHASVCERGACFWSVSRDGCESVGAPTVAARPPEDPAVGMTADRELYLGLRAIHLTYGQSNQSPQMQEAEAFGLDLDATCSNVTDCPRDNQVSCHGQDPASQQDGPGCRDNALAGLMRKVAQSAELTEKYGWSESAINCELWRGGYNVLAKISGYNGASDDSAVRVDWYSSSGLEAQPAWQCPERYFARNHAGWASDASWSVDARELTAQGSERGQLPPSRTFDAEAFVREGWLVSRLPDGASLRFAGGARGLSLSVQGAWWIGRLEPMADGQWSLRDGLVAGRVAVQDLLRSVRQLGVCEQGAGAGQYAMLTQDIMARADVLASGELDPSRACDALSFGIAFEAAQVTPGSMPRTAAALVECCEPGAPSPQCQAQPSCGDGVVSGSERCDTAIARGATGACPDACPNVSPCMLGMLAGSGCDAHCELQTITAAHPGDGCCPDGADPHADSDCNTHCGNGVVEPGETCDPPASCPTCTSADKCLQVTTVGAAASCNVSCRIVSINECRSEDGCCPSSCMHGGDNDCSSRCGDGKVDPGTTETCEPRSAQDCPRSCDDGEPCTQDIQTGSTSNCNVRCSHFPITALIPNDGCCPKGATPASDADCK